MKENMRDNISHSPPWLDLPTDLWYVIMEYLNLADQIRLLFVCKIMSSKLSLLHKNPMNQLPWLLQFEITDEFICKLFDPIHDHQQHPPYQIYRMEKFCPDYFVSKHGWLFLLKEVRRYCSKFITKAFLFCPYKKEIILLPELHCNLPDKFEKLCFDMNAVYCFESPHMKPIATFSTSNPNSENCVFFVVYYYVRKKIINVSSCQRNDKEWGTHEFMISGEEIYSTIISALYHEGKLYILMECGFEMFVVIYNDHSKTFTTLDITNPFFNLEDYPFYRLVVVKGLLHLVVSNIPMIEYFGGFEERDEELPEFDFSSCKLFKWKTIWDYSIRDEGGDGDGDFEVTDGDTDFEETIENQALFLGSAIWDSPFVVEDLVGDQLGFLGNKVIYHEKPMKFFDLSERTVGIQKKYFIGKEEEDGRYKGMMWIEPPNHVNELVKFC